MRIKICGVCVPEELQLLDRCGVDFAGVWWQLGQGERNLGDEPLARLLRTPRTRVRPMLVTLGRSVDELAAQLKRHRLAAVQLSGFELPGFVASLRRCLPALQIFKSLHVQSGQCLEARFLDAYLAAGVDVFIVDSFVSRQALGSTGVRVPAPVVAELAARLGPGRLMLAGGVDAELLADAIPPALWGIDVDSAVRGAAGLDAGKVQQLVAAARQDNGPSDVDLDEVDAYGSAA